MIITRIIKLPSFGIRVELLTENDEIVGSTISSKGLLSRSSNDSEFNSFIHGVECMILAHATQGIDIESPSYLAGIEDAIQSADHHL